MEKHDLSFDKVVLDYDELVKVAILGLAMATRVLEENLEYVRNNAFKGDYSPVATEYLAEVVQSYHRINNTVYALVNGKDRATKELK